MTVKFNIPLTNDTHEIDEWRRQIVKYLSTLDTGMAGYYTKAEIDALLLLKSDTSHTHDDRYYTETESNSTFAAKVHTHDDRYYTETESDNTFIAKSILTAKGDLLSYSTALAKLGVGTNGQVLTAQSGETTGLKWETPSSTSESFLGKLAAVQAWPNGGSSSQYFNDEMVSSINGSGVAVITKTGKYFRIKIGANSTSQAMEFTALDSYTVSSVPDSSSVVLYNPLDTDQDWRLSFVFRYDD